jgi:hypothetical protein
MALRNLPSLAEASEQLLSAAVKSTLQTYTQKMEQFGGPRVDDSQKLEDFWKMKKVMSSGVSSASTSTSGSSLLDQQRDEENEMVEYDWISIVDTQGVEIDYACYLLLPGGSCYGPRSPPSGTSSTASHLHYH